MYYSTVHVLYVNVVTYVCIVCVYLAVLVVTGVQTHQWFAQHVDI